jgi:hypothetical protein
MKTTFTLIVAAIFSCLWMAPQARGQGFTDAYVLFYGEVRQAGGGATVLLQSGELAMTFINETDPTNRVVIKTPLRPTGSGAVKAYSYALKVPVAYLPEAPRIGEFLSIGTNPTTFKLEDITIDGTPATLPDGSKEFYGLSFASRASDYRLDLLVSGDSEDADGDGIPDWWEELHSLDPTITDSADDLDEDGWSNLQEFQRGSDPNVSNRDPKIATAEIFVPESGTAGMYLKFLDSDTADSGIQITLPSGATSGFEIAVDGAPLAAAGSTQFVLTDFQSGRLTIAHIDRGLRQFPLPISWSDGGETFSGQVFVKVLSPSSSDGADASLWLDGFDLADGAPIGNWADRSGNARHAMQPSADHQPVAAGGAADFSASSTAHLFFQDGALPAGDHTVLAAYSAASSSDTAQTLLSTNRGYLEIAATTQAISYPGAAAYQMDDMAVRGYESAAAATTTSIFRRKGSLLENVFGLSYDGESVAAANLDPVLPVLGGRRPAIPGSDPVEQAFGGQIHELLIFPTALAEQKLRDAHDYLQSKWSDAVIWDQSTELKNITLAASGGGARRQIIRGGHGADQLGGGSEDDTISGGPGADILTGGAGRDRFVFGGVDTGNDRITDFDQEADIIDLSAAFFGQTGDARQFLTVRLDTDYSNPVPVLDSVLVVQRPDGSTQEIVLENTVVNAADLIRLVVEGRIRMGGLSIPTGLEITLAPGATDEPLSESLAEPFEVVLTRSGDGVAGALDVALGFFDDTTGGHFVVNGATSSEGQRSVVSFARDETSKTVTVRPIPDLETGGLSTVQVTVLPNYRYSVGGNPAELAIIDIPMVWLEVVQPSAVASTSQPARVKVLRDGNVDESLVVDLVLGGAAEQGVHIQTSPATVTILPGQSFAEVEISALAAGLTEGPKLVLFQLASSDRYQLGNPHEGILYAANTSDEADNAGFDRWLATASNGQYQSREDLLLNNPQQLGDYLRAYAFGLQSVDALASNRMSFRMVDGRPLLSILGELNAADLRWGVQESLDMENWNEVGDTFERTWIPGGLQLLGQAPRNGEPTCFYRLSMNLDSAQAAATAINGFAGATNFGITGNASWNSDGSPGGGLVSAGGVAGEISQIIAEVSGPKTLNFEMEVVGGSATDRFSFYIDGVKQDETSATPIQVLRELTESSTHLLMWEFQQGTGRASIRNWAP